MRYLTIILIILCPIVIEISLQSSDVSIPISQPLTGDNKTAVQGLLNNIPSNPALVIDEITNQLVQIPVNRLSRFILPFDVITMAQKTNLSILRPLDTTAYTNYPSGSALFPKNANIAQQFDTVISSIKTNNELIKFFRKIHFNCLNQLYVYFMKIHTNFIMQHPGSSRTSNGSITIDSNAFFLDEKSYATNQKNLIISFFVNLIESQFHSMIIACAPKLPYIFATPSGKILIQNDFSIDLSVFALPQTDEVLQQIQSSYLNFLKTYITFFQLQTSLLTQQDATTGFTQFVTAAQAIQNGNFNMNPAMFFYDDESMRAIKMIPYLAARLAPATKSIGWAPDAMNAATKNIMNDNHPIAYFKDAANNSVNNASQASHLCIVSMTGDNMFEEELIAQPDWLNSYQGIINMLQACLGDFSKLANLNILDPFTQAIIDKAVNGSINVQTTQTVQDLVTALTPTTISQ